AEPWPPPAAQVGEQRELAHDEVRTTHLLDRQVGATLCILKVAQAEQPVRQAVDDLGRIPDADSHQDGGAPSDRAEDHALRADLGPAGPLHDEPPGGTRPATPL